MGVKENCRNELRAAVRQLSDRCLYSASKWAAEQLVGIEQDPAKYTPSHTRFQRGSSSIRRRFRTATEATFTSTPAAGVSHVATPPVLEDDSEAVDSDFYLLAKSYFDCREYRRATHVLRDQTGKKAVFLRCYALFLPSDSRLWIAMAQCYETEQLHMLEEAIKCYRRAANCNDREAIALHQLAKLHAELGRSEEAAFYYKKDLEIMEAEEREGPNLVEALMFLARYYKAQKRFEDAEVYCTRLLDYSGPEKETAKSLLRGIRYEMDVEHLPP